MGSATGGGGCAEKWTRLNRLMPIRLRAGSAGVGGRGEGVFPGRAGPISLGVLDMKQRVTVQKDVL
jgi:hypothetical protein